MKSAIKLLLSVFLTIQTVSPLARAGEYSDQDDDWNTHCEQCLTEDAQSGDLIYMGGQVYELTDFYPDVNGHAMWDSRSFGSLEEYNDNGSDNRISHDQGQDYTEPNYEGSNIGDLRLTGYDFPKLEYGVERTQSEEVQKIYRKLRRIVVDRINGETSADTEATEKTLAAQVDSLKGSLGQVREFDYQGPVDPNSTVDPVAGIYGILEGKIGSGSFYSSIPSWQVSDATPLRSSQKDELYALRQRLDTSTPQSAVQADAKGAAYRAISEFDKYLWQQGKKDADAILGLIKILVDFATDTIPITSVPKDLYRAFVAKDPVTGRPLEKWERGLAAGFVAGSILTAGALAIVSPEIRAFARMANASEKEVAAAARASKTLEGSNALRTLERSAETLKKTMSLSPSLENRRLVDVRKYTERAWDEGKTLIKGVTSEVQTFVRFIGPQSHTNGSWIAVSTDFKGMNPEEIRNALALEHTPTGYQVVKVPADTEVLIGYVSPNRWGGKSEQLQMFIENPKEGYFSGVKKLGSSFGGI